MKLLLSTASPGLNGALDPRFGRCTYFTMVDTESMASSDAPNPALSASGGAGVQAAQFATLQGCQAVVSGDFGPNAFDALAAAGIEMYKYGDCSTIQEVVQRYKNGQLEKVSGPGHTGKHGR